MTKWDHLIDIDEAYRHKHLGANSQDIRIATRKVLAKPMDRQAVTNLHSMIGYTRQAFKIWDVIARRHPDLYHIRAFWLNAAAENDVPVYKLEVYEYQEHPWEEGEDEPDTDTDLVIDEEMSLEDVLVEASNKYINARSNSDYTHWWESHPEENYSGGTKDWYHFHLNYIFPFKGLLKNKRGYLLRADWDRINDAIKQRITDASRVPMIDPWVIRP